MIRHLIVCFPLLVFGALSPDASGAIEYNQTIVDLKKELALCQEKASLTQEAQELEETRQKAISLRQQITKIQQEWKEKTLSQGALQDDPYALWDVGETTLSQLILEYGAVDALYAIPQEISAMKIHLHSTIPLPRESWSEMIELILHHNGIGIETIHPFVKQLYIMKLNPSAIEAVLSNEADLGKFSSSDRILFVFAPPVEQVRSLQSFFERFSDPKQTVIQAVGSKVLLLANKETIGKLLGLYRAVWENAQGKIVRLVPTTKMGVADADKVLKAFFSDTAPRMGGGRPGPYSTGADDLVSFALPQGLVLVGETQVVERGEKMLRDLETQLDDPGENVIYWYTCKHSNPEDIACILDQVYGSLLHAGLEKKCDSSSCGPPPAPSSPPLPPSTPNLSSEPSPAPLYPGQNTIFNPVLPANPPFIQPGTIEKDKKTAFGNFIADVKTTSVLMVVRREDLPKIKSLLKKMDVPKRMVQLDVLLVEKKLTDRRQLGFNLLQFGTNSSGKKENAVTFDTAQLAPNKGILSYIFSRPSGKFPAADIKFNFLLAQDNVRINANPSVLAINQTPATVSIVEEISINNGAFPIQTQSGVLVEQSFTRAQYGITIVLTPTIHLPDKEDPDQSGFVSLTTNLEFDTTQISTNDRPPVTRRHVENQVCIADGETVILGGLRRKIEEDSREKIPFLADLPGLGKLFGSVKETDTNTEMFIFITPHIIRHEVDDLRRIRQEEYKKRAGDIPEFLQRLDEAKQKDRNSRFQNSLKLLLDM